MSWPLLLTLALLWPPAQGIARTFFNHSRPHDRPTFVVNFDISTVICQHSSDPEDLHLHDISILCDGHQDCYDSPSIGDETFPFCDHKCNSTCSGHGACLYDGQKSQCYCSAGFQGPKCELSDANECTGKPCHWLAQCQNTVGAHECRCLPGFEGNGHDCTDVDECALGIADCPTHSTCVNLPGTFMCNCSQGFAPKGVPTDRCVDVDECELGVHNCAATLCQNSVGGFSCVDECEAGFFEENGKCVDKDECKLGQHQCSPRANCRNRPGGYDCFCEDGFQGNGHQCEPIYDCSQNPHICDRHAHCSGGSCVCQSGYSGDGLVCTDVNECEETNVCANQNNHKCVNVLGGYVCCDPNEDEQRCLMQSGMFCAGGCGQNAVCFNHTCTCMSGFEGNPNHKCTDVNECHREDACPGAGQWCANMIGGHICCSPASDLPECRGLELVPSLVDGDVQTDSEANNEDVEESVAEAQAIAQLKGSKSRAKQTSNELESFEKQTSKKRRRFRTKTTHIGRALKTHSGGFVIVRKPNGHTNETDIGLDLKGFGNCEGNDRNCPEHAICHDQKCQCRIGFEWNSTQGKCEDINECLVATACPTPSGSLSVWCINTAGSYRCCREGSSAEECGGMEIHEQVQVQPVPPTADKNGTRGPGVFKTVEQGMWHNKTSKHLIVGRGRIPAQKFWGLELTGRSLFSAFPEWSDPLEVSTAKFDSVQVAPLESSLVGPTLPPTGLHSFHSVPLTPTDRDGTVRVQNSSKGTYRFRTLGNGNLPQLPSLIDPRNPIVIPSRPLNTADFLQPADLFNDTDAGGENTDTFSARKHAAGSVGFILRPHGGKSGDHPFVLPPGVQFKTIKIPSATSTISNGTDSTADSPTKTDDGGAPHEQHRVVKVDRGETGLLIKGHHARGNVTSNESLFNGNFTATSPELTTQAVDGLSTTTSLSRPDDARGNDSEELLPPTPPQELGITHEGEEWIIEDESGLESVQVPESQETLKPQTKPVTKEVWLRRTTQPMKPSTQVEVTTPRTTDSPQATESLPTETKSPSEIGFSKSTKATKVFSKAMTNLRETTLMKIMKMTTPQTTSGPRTKDYDASSMPSTFGIRSEVATTTLAGNDANTVGTDVHLATDNGTIPQSESPAIVSTTEPIEVTGTSVRTETEPRDTHASSSNRAENVEITTPNATQSTMEMDIENRAPLINTAHELGRTAMEPSSESTLKPRYVSDVTASSQNPSYQSENTTTQTTSQQPDFNVTDAPRNKPESKMTPTETTTLQSITTTKVMPTLLSTKFVDEVTTTQSITPTAPEDTPASTQSKVNMATDVKGRSPGDIERGTSPTPPQSTSSTDTVETPKSSSKEENTTTDVTSQSTSQPASDTTLLPSPPVDLHETTSQGDLHSTTQTDVEEISTTSVGPDTISSQTTSEQTSSKGGKETTTSTVMSSGTEKESTDKFLQSTLKTDTSPTELINLETSSTKNVAETTSHNALVKPQTKSTHVPSNPDSEVSDVTTSPHVESGTEANQQTSAYTVQSDSVSEVTSTSQSESVHSGARVTHTASESTLHPEIKSSEVTEMPRNGPEVRKSSSNSQAETEGTTPQTTMSSTSQTDLDDTSASHIAPNDSETEAPQTTSPYTTETSAEAGDIATTSHITPILLDKGSTRQTFESTATSDSVTRVTPTTESGFEMTESAVRNDSAGRTAPSTLRPTDFGKTSMTLPNSIKSEATGQSLPPTAQTSTVSGVTAMSDVLQNESKESTSPTPTSRANVWKTSTSHHETIESVTESSQRTSQSTTQTDAVSEVASTLRVDVVELGTVGVGSTTLGHPPVATTSQMIVQSTSTSEERATPGTGLSEPGRTAQSLYHSTSKPINEVSEVTTSQTYLHSTLMADTEEATRGTPSELEMTSLSPDGETTPAIGQSTASIHVDEITVPDGVSTASSLIFEKDDKKMVSVNSGDQVTQSRGNRPMTVETSLPAIKGDSSGITSSNPDHPSEIAGTRQTTLDGRHYGSTTETNSSAITQNPTEIIESMVPEHHHLPADRAESPANIGRSNVTPSPSPKLVGLETSRGPPELNTVLKMTTKTRSEVEQAVSKPDVGSRTQSGKSKKQLPTEPDRPSQPQPTKASAPEDVTVISRVSNKVTEPRSEEGHPNVTEASTTPTLLVRSTIGAIPEDEDESVEGTTTSATTHDSEPLSQTFGKSTTLIPPPESESKEGLEISGTQTGDKITSGFREVDGFPQETRTSAFSAIQITRGDRGRQLTKHTPSDSAHQSGLEIVNKVEVSSPTTSELGIATNLPTVPLGSQSTGGPTEAKKSTSAKSDSQETNIHPRGRSKQVVITHDGLEITPDKNNPLTTGGLRTPISTESGDKPIHSKAGTPSDLGTNTKTTIETDDNILQSQGTTTPNAVTENTAEPGNFVTTDSESARATKPRPVSTNGPSELSPTSTSQSENPDLQTTSAKPVDEAKGLTTTEDVKHAPYGRKEGRSETNVSTKAGRGKTDDEDKRLTTTEDVKHASYGRKEGRSETTVSTKPRSGKTDDESTFSQKPNLSANIPIKDHLFPKPEKSLNITFTTQNATIRPEIAKGNTDVGLTGRPANTSVLRSIVKERGEHARVVKFPKKSSRPQFTGLEISGFEVTQTSLLPHFPHFVVSDNDHASGSINSQGTGLEISGSDLKEVDLIATAAVTKQSSTRKFDIAQSSTESPNTKTQSTESETATQGLQIIADLFTTSKPSAESTSTVTASTRVVEGQESTNAQFSTPTTEYSPRASTETTSVIKELDATTTQSTSADISHPETERTNGIEITFRTAEFTPTTFGPESTFSEKIETTGEPKTPTTAAARLITTHDDITEDKIPLITGRKSKTFETTVTTGFKINHNRKTTKERDERVTFAQTTTSVDVPKSTKLPELPPKESVSSSTAQSTSEAQQNTKPTVSSTLQTSEAPPSTFVSANTKQPVTEEIFVTTTGQTASGEREETKQPVDVMQTTRQSAGFKEEVASLGTTKSSSQTEISSEPTAFDPRTPEVTEPTLVTLSKAQSEIKPTTVAVTESFTTQNQVSEATTSESTPANDFSTTEATAETDQSTKPANVPPHSTERITSSTETSVSTTTPESAAETSQTADQHVIVTTHLSSIKTDSEVWTTSPINTTPEGAVNDNLRSVAGQVTTDGSEMTTHSNAIVEVDPGEMGLELHGVEGVTDRSTQATVEKSAQTTNPPPKTGATAIDVTTTAGLQIVFEEKSPAVQQHTTEAVEKSSETQSGWQSTTTTTSPELVTSVTDLLSSSTLPDAFDVTVTLPNWKTTSSSPGTSFEPTASTSPEKLNTPGELESATTTATPNESSEVKLPPVTQRIQTSSETTTTTAFEISQPTIENTSGTSIREEPTTTSVSATSSSKTTEEEIALPTTTPSHSGEREGTEQSPRPADVTQSNKQSEVPEETFVSLNTTQSSSQTDLSTRPSTLDVNVSDVPGSFVLLSTVQPELETTEGSVTTTESSTLPDDVTINEPQETVTSGFESTQSRTEKTTPNGPTTVENTASEPQSSTTSEYTDSTPKTNTPSEGVGQTREILDVLSTTTDTNTERTEFPSKTTSEPADITTQTSISSAVTESETSQTARTVGLDSTNTERTEFPSKSTSESEGITTPPSPSSTAVTESETSHTAITAELDSTNTERTEFPSHTTSESAGITTQTSPSTAVTESETSQTAITAELDSTNTERTEFLSKTTSEPADITTPPSPSTAVTESETSQTARTVGLDSTSSRPSLATSDWTQSDTRYASTTPTSTTSTQAQPVTAPEGTLEESRSSTDSEFTETSTALFTVSGLTLVDQSKPFGVDKATSAPHFTKLQRETTFDSDQPHESSEKGTFGLIISGSDAPIATTPELGLVIGRQDLVPEKPVDENEQGLQIRGQEVSNKLPTNSVEVVEVDEATESPETLIKKANDLLVQQGRILPEGIRTTTTSERSGPDDRVLINPATKNDTKSSTNIPQIGHRNIKPTTINNKENEKTESDDGGHSQGGIGGKQGSIVQKGREYKLTNNTVISGKVIGASQPATTTVKNDVFPTSKLPPSSIEETEQPIVGLEISGNDLKPTEIVEERGLEISGEDLLTTPLAETTPKTRSHATSIGSIPDHTRETNAKFTGKPHLSTTVKSSSVASSTTTKATNTERPTAVTSATAEKERKQGKQSVGGNVEWPTSQTSRRIPKPTTPLVIIPDEEKTKAESSERAIQKTTRANPFKPSDATESNTPLPNEIGLEISGKDLEPDTKPTAATEKSVRPSTLTTQRSLPESTTPAHSRNKPADGLQTPEPDEQGLIISGGDLAEEASSTTPPTTTSSAVQTTTHGEQSTEATTSHQTVPVVTTGDIAKGPEPGEQGLVISGDDIQPEDQGTSTSSPAPTSTTKPALVETTTKRAPITVEVPRPDEQGLMISGLDVEPFPTETTSTTLKNEPEPTSTILTSVPTTVRATTLEEEGLMISGNDIESPTPKNESRKEPTVVVDSGETVEETDQGALPPTEHTTPNAGLEESTTTVVVSTIATTEESTIAAEVTEGQTSLGSGSISTAAAIPEGEVEETSSPETTTHFEAVEPETSTVVPVEASTFAQSVPTERSTHETTPDETDLKTTTMSTTEEPTTSSTPASTETTESVFEIKATPQSTTHVESITGPTPTQATVARKKSVTVKTTTGSPESIAQSTPKEVTETVVELKTTSGGIELDAVTEQSKPLENEQPGQETELPSASSTPVPARPTDAETTVHSTLEWEETTVPTTAEPTEPTYPEETIGTTESETTNQPTTTETILATDQETTEDTSATPFLEIQTTSASEISSQTTPGNEISPTTTSGVGVEVGRPEQTTQLAVEQSTPAEDTTLATLPTTSEVIQVKDETLLPTITTNDLSTPEPTSASTDVAKEATFTTKSVAETTGELFTLTTVDVETTPSTTVKPTPSRFTDASSTSAKPTPSSTTLNPTTSRVTHASSPATVTAEPHVTRGTVKSITTTRAPQPAPSSTTAIPAFLKRPRCLSSDECGNDAYCNRKEGGVCQCRPGFAEKEGVCVDVDECSLNLHNCHQNSVCRNYIGGFACDCAIGWRRNQFTECVDIDECAEKNATLCHSEAECVNRDGAYDCKCNDGFEGDGYFCYPQEKRHCTPEEWTKTDCKRSQMCLVDKGGQLSCEQCKNGFHMVNGVCADVNECSLPSTNLCHEHALCHNTFGSYRCECQPGMKGDGFDCVDIDECSVIRPCHPLAQCTNIVGTYMCSCPQGWLGDGRYRCVNPDDRRCDNKGYVCSSKMFAACLSVDVDKEPVSFCECEEGYRFNNVTKQCNDIDECAEDRNSCDPKLAKCSNYAGGYMCECNRGFEGRGGECVDIDECHRGTHNCHTAARCTNQVGTFSCECERGFTGDGHHCDAILQREPSLPTTPSPTTKFHVSCTDDWNRYCRLLNKTCYVDDEEVLQCGGCLDGFQPMGDSCKPIAGSGPCARNNDCDSNADCVDVNDVKHKCVCRKGFIGDGIHCDDIDECTMDGICDPNASCHNYKGGFACSCSAGFVGNGFSCRPLPTNPPPSAVTSSDNGYESPSESPITPTPTPSPNPTVQYSSTTTTRSTTSTPFYLKFSRPTTPDTFKYDATYVVPQQKPKDAIESPNCARDSRISCHPLASCNHQTGQCQCSPGYQGDGFTSCSRVWEDCQSNVNQCDENAICNKASGQCECEPGFMGDGLNCVPDRLDCEVREGLCSEFADCMWRRCVCKPGFTGDGLMCFSMAPKLNRFDCLNCHCRADCVQGECKCQPGFLGNGLVCVPDPADCINYPGVCHSNGFCNNGTRKCECNAEYIGNGYNCALRKSCVVRPGLCDINADCMPSGQCKCRSGHFGDGLSCKAYLTVSDLRKPQTYPIPVGCPYCGMNQECINGACKCSAGYSTNLNGVCIDVDECLTGAAACHPSAKCRNTEGSYECHCPSGMSGDGRDCQQEYAKASGISVQCKGDGMLVEFQQERTPFSAHMFVKGQANNEHCSQLFKHANGSISLFIPVEHCNFDLESDQTLATTLIVQRHASLVTSEASAYRLRCAYPIGEKLVESRVQVQDLVPNESQVHDALVPVCQFSVTNLEDIVVDKAQVGQVLKLSLTTEPEPEFGILPRNCFTINLETAERYQLTDAAGCAIDTDLFPEWRRLSKSHMQAVFRSFKWPESTMIRFECDCQPCASECDDAQCGKRRSTFKMRKMRHVAPELPADSLNITRPTFSQVVQVHEPEEEQKAIREWENWLSRGSMDEDVYAEEASERICVSAVWVVVSVMSVALASSTLLAMFVLYRRHLTSGHCQPLKSAHDEDNISYIQF